MVKNQGFSKGQMPFGDLFMKGHGREDLNPFGPAGLEKCEADPKIAKWLKDDINFRN